MAVRARVCFMYCPNSPGFLELKKKRGRACVRSGTGRGGKEVGGKKKKREKIGEEKKKERKKKKGADQIQSILRGASPPSLTYIHPYICIYLCVCICVLRSSLYTAAAATHPPKINSLKNNSRRPRSPGPPAIRFPCRRPRRN